MSKFLEWLLNLFRRQPVPQPQPPTVDPPIPRPAPPGPPGITPPIVPSDQAVALFVAINAARAAHGVGSLAAEPRLMEVAGDHSAENAATGLLTHTWEDGRSLGDHVTASGVAWRGVGECLAEGQQTAGEVVAAWLNHGPHRVIVLGDFTSVGCGVADAPSDVFWAAVFAR
jgi:uncharacterized protein YkwD